MRRNRNEKEVVIRRVSCNYSMDVTNFAKTVGILDAISLQVQNANKILSFSLRRSELILNRHAAGKDC